MTWARSVGVSYDNYDLNVNDDGNKKCHGYLDISHDDDDNDADDDDDDDDDNDDDDASMIYPF